MFWFFGPKACGILAPQPGMEPTPPALEGEVLTTGPPGKSQWLLFNLEVSRRQTIREQTSFSHRVSVALESYIARLL